MGNSISIPLFLAARFSATVKGGKCTALANVGMMLKCLRPAGGDGRANTRLSAYAEPQRRDSNRSIGRILMWKKLSVFNQKQRTCRRKKCLSRTWVLRDLENRSFQASERTWRSRQNSRCTPFTPNCWRGLRVGWSPKEKWQITKILREVFLSRGPLSV